MSDAPRADLELAGGRLLLQNYGQQDRAHDFIIHVRVPESWGFRVAYVHDPSGVLLHIAQPLPRP